jgi:septum formation topological specificity factor MinE
MCEESRTAGTITDTEENIAKLKPSELEQARREFMAVIDRFLRHV